MSRLRGMDGLFSLRMIYAAWPAKTVRHEPAVGAPREGRAIFDQPGAVILGGDVVTTEPTLRWPRDAFAAVVRGDVFVIDGRRYRVSEPPQPSLDGDEISAPLERAA